VSESQVLDMIASEESKNVNAGDKNLIFKEVSNSSAISYPKDRATEEQAGNFGKGVLDPDRLELPDNR